MGTAQSQELHDLQWTACSQMSQDSADERCSVFMLHILDYFMIQWIINQGLFELAGDHGGGWGAQVSVWGQLGGFLISHTTNPLFLTTPNFP